jgi:hypothetical protein
MGYIPVPRYCWIARVLCPSLASLKPQAWRNMWGWTGKGKPAACPMRVTSLRTAAVVRGAPAFCGEHVGAGGALLALEPPERSTLGPSKGMGRREAAL